MDCPGNRDSDITKTTSNEAPCIGQPCPDDSTGISTSKKNMQKRRPTRTELNFSGYPAQSRQRIGVWGLLQEIWVLDTWIFQCAVLSACFGQFFSRYIISPAIDVVSSVLAAAHITCHIPTTWLTTVSTSGSWAEKVRTSDGIVNMTGAGRIEGCLAPVPEMLHCNRSTLVSAEGIPRLEGSRLSKCIKGCPP
ncbi:hypothetical protein M404DRAFT_866851 [Pisolithus tinctorius Marx 270]|uniref:Uncharacterized protein n=1 Tax=Pisolithus tinctorius Marx 270 TaxID=870435 RepID=A0A0C3NQV9_PISTI|nr:hypothetical protein M404DRAFT_866851 [Pisolithus tinctorius Marx 270]